MDTGPRTCVGFTQHRGALAQTRDAQTPRPVDAGHAQYHELGTALGAPRAEERLRCHAPFGSCGLRARLRRFIGQGAAAIAVHAARREVDDAIRSRVEARQQVPQARIVAAGRRRRHRIEQDPGCREIERRRGAGVEVLDPDHPAGQRRTAQAQARASRQRVEYASPGVAGADNDVVHAPSRRRRHPLPAPRSGRHAGPAAPGAVIATPVPARRGRPPPRRPPRRAGRAGGRIPDTRPDSA